MLASLLLSALALAATVPAPIHIDSCSFVRAGSFEHSVRVRFHNASARTVSLVAFNVHNGSHHIVINDSGSFTPGTAIDHVLTTPTWELFHAQAHTCTVAHVRFADGSAWSPNGR